MVETPATRTWIGRSTWLGLAGLLIFLRLLPLDTMPRGWAPPDVLLAITLVWAVRRPDWLPVSFVALVFLLTDFLFHRPPGLWTALVVLLTEFLRNRSVAMRNMPFALEWLMIAAGVAGITFAYRLILALAMAPQAPLPPTVIQAALTILAYPLVVLLAHAAFGVRRPAPGEVDSLGHRI